MLLLLACADPDLPAAPLATCPAPGEPTVLADGFADGTEGIAFSGDTLYVAEPEGVVTVGVDGAVTPLADVPAALGLAPASQGGVHVADPGVFDFSGDDDDGVLHHLASDGTLTTLAAGMPNPNFVLAAPWGDLLVSDDTGDTVYEVDPQGGVSPWLGSVPSPNGMAWSGDTLLVVSTMVPEPPLWAVPVADGVAGEPVPVRVFDTGDAPDGVAVDSAGGAWVALNLVDELVRVDVATGEVTDVVEGITAPASLAFGAAEGFDPCSLYVTELRGERVWRVPVAVR